MSLVLLPNNVGYAASTLDLNAGSSASGYDINDLISGPRSTQWRSAATSGDVQPGYSFGSNTAATHIVIARADWLLTQNGTRIRPIQKNSGGTWSVVSGVDYNPLALANLIGPYNQDLAFAFTPTDLRGFGIRTDRGSGTEAAQISKLYVSNAFSFGVEPHFLQSPPVLELLQASSSPTLFTPQRSFEPYDVEASFTLVWEAVTLAKITEFKAIPALMRWPLFLYDDTGDVFAAKLEHVVVQDFTETSAGQGYRNITIMFLRLKHYDV